MNRRELDRIATIFATGLIFAAFVWYVGVVMNPPPDNPLKAEPYVSAPDKTEWPWSK